MDITKQDWCLFRNKIAAWQEAYMEQQNQEYTDILSGQGNPPQNFGYWKNESTKTNDAIKHLCDMQL